jgi:repressor LexA
MLTRKQHELLLFIKDRMDQDAVPPSFDEMKEALGLRSKSGIHRLITALEERGFIRRLPHRARALEILRLPEGGEERAARPALASQAQGNGGQRFAATIIKGDFGAAMAGRPVLRAAEQNQLPLYGRIAAGTPIEALRDHTATVDIPASLLGKGDFYALEVAGDSMIDAGINDGDTVIIKREDSADNGSIVVALVDNQEATLKRLRRKGDMIALEPANRSYETRLLSADRVKVQGRLWALMRRY